MLDNYEIRGQVVYCNGEVVHAADTDQGAWRWWARNLNIRNDPNWSGPLDVQ